MKRKKAQKGFGQLAIKHLQKSPTCEAMRCITWQSGHTTRLGLAPPAPPSTSQPKSHVSVCADRVAERVSASDHLSRFQAFRD